MFLYMNMELVNEQLVTDGSTTATPDSRTTRRTSQQPDRHTLG